MCGNHVVANAKLVKFLKFLKFLNFPNFPNFPIITSKPYKLLGLKWWKFSIFYYLWHH